jgi:hypothetical protein
VQYPTAARIAGKIKPVERSEDIWSPNVGLKTQLNLPYGLQKSYKISSLADKTAAWKR